MQHPADSASPLRRAACGPRRLCALCAALLLALPAAASAAPAAAAVPAAHAASAATEGFRAGVVLTEAEAAAFRFRTVPIPDAVFARMRGKSWLPACGHRRADFRYLEVLHYDLEGRIRTGELVLHRSVAGEALEIFEALFVNRYPIGGIRLIDDFDADDERSMTANNTSAFCCRTVMGTKRLSAHARGLAVDLNPLYNPYVRGAVVQPAAGRPWAGAAARRGEPPVIGPDDLAVRLFAARGWTWGGSWKSLRDYQHFEKAAP